VVGRGAAQVTIRLFVDEVRAGEVVIDGGELHYLARVRRGKVGQRVELVDGAGRRAEAIVEAVAADAARLRAGDVEVVPPARPRVRALLPWIKGERMEVCVEKLVEVGCDEIAMWQAAHAIVRVPAEKLEERLQKLRDAVRAAARQCGAANATVVAGGGPLDEVLRGLPEAGLRMVLAPDAAVRLDGNVAALRDAADVTIASGPEGGLAADEIVALLAAGFVAIGLGPRVLRAETAPVVAVAVIRATTGT
jgi:16S rRNA (uracil1498-N3)-methyltransferase